LTASAGQPRCKPSLKDGCVATISLCFGRAGHGANEHITAGNALPTWPSNTWLARQVADLRKAELTAAGCRALASVTGGYQQRVAQQRQDGHDPATARRLVWDEPGTLGKAFPLPQRRWLAINGRTGETKLPCVKYAGTPEVMFLEPGVRP
jgi:hypothetical protein